MKAILYVGHGTRLKKGVDEAIRFIEITKSFVEAEIQETAFLELVEPNIVEGIANCVNQGATHISVVPILLLTAQHANKDIPAEIKIAKERFPHLKFTIGRPLGIHSSLIETVFERIEEQQVPINADAEVILIGRGSSDNAVVRDMAIISEQLKATYGFREVKSCFLYGAGPSFEQTLVELKTKQIKQVFIVPYLLFSGLLSVGIEKKILALDLDPASVILCNHLGYNEKVRNVLLERVKEVI
ncbi:sirohydrochlorin chelatase [Solibacillus isronensis]|uniref:sirohydrochlorin chelatase n=1 Tax=Solibacillus isronensis TaxID=412383 RepID=UPI00203B5FFF|nr:sirohydrochlorin chelatase [Solibacillus isronensis]MCM3720602.1 sirohydrochlorin chelatase [Solibacillus isronensis]